MTDIPASAAPQRLLALDTVRGVAVMGILLLNIIAFAMPEAAYMNPRAYGGADGLDRIVYFINFILFDGKMRGLFSFLFGASMLLVIERAEAKGESSAGVHYMRMVWLLVFGLAHLWLIWWGDILHLYALVGMVAFAFRKASTKKLVRWGIALVLLQCLIFAWMYVGTVFAEQAVHSAKPEAAEMARKFLADLSKGFGTPPADVIARELAVHRGGYIDLVRARIAQHGMAPVTSVLLFGAETLAYMLFGMAALRSGLLAGEWTRARYLRWLTIGFCIGIPGYVALAIWAGSSDFSLRAMVGAFAFSTPFRPFMVVGWACLILLLMRDGGALTTRIAAAGRMAFSNYLGTSLVCSTLFYGYGLALYGQLSRAEVYLVVFAVWALILLWSKPWLARFRYGPFEWAWRSLARGEMQPMRGAAR